MKILSLENIVMFFQLIHALWMGQSWAAGERQEDPSEDEKIQDKTCTNEEPIPRGEALKFKLGNFSINQIALENLTNFEDDL